MDTEPNVTSDDDKTIEDGHAALRRLKSASAALDYYRKQYAADPEDYNACRLIEAWKGMRESIDRVVALPPLTTDRIGLAACEDSDADAGSET